MKFGAVIIGGSLFGLLVSRINLSFSRVSWRANRKINSKIFPVDVGFGSGRGAIAVPKVETFGSRFVELFNVPLSRIGSRVRAFCFQNSSLPRLDINGQKFIRRKMYSPNQIRPKNDYLKKMESKRYSRENYRVRDLGNNIPKARHSAA